jgi:hypothetical protein
MPSDEVTDNQSSKVTCKLCCMDIPKLAKKCPYCQHWQFRWNTIIFHPVFAIAPLIIVFIIFLSMMQFMFRNMIVSKEQFSPFVDQISITKSKMEFGEDQNGEVVVVIGKMKNASPVDWKDVRIHADFFNGNEELIDTGQQESYTWRLPGDDELAFKVSFQCLFPEKDYVSHKVRVISAVDAKNKF